LEKQVNIVTLFAWTSQHHIEGWVKRPLQIHKA